MFPCAVVATPITSARSSFSAIVKLTAGDVAACPLRNVITPTAPPIDWTPVLAATSILFSSLDIALLIVSVATIELLSVPFSYPVRAISLPFKVISWFRDNPFTFLVVGTLLLSSDCRLLILLIERFGISVSSIGNFVTSINPFVCVTDLTNPLSLSATVNSANLTSI